MFEHFALSLGAGLLAGCSSSFAPSPVEPNQTSIGTIQGIARGGQAPITGSQIYLFAAGTGGYGTSATSLITSGKPGVTCNPSSGMPYAALNGACYVGTDANGNFSLGGDFTCTQGQQVYMVSTGGNPGQSRTVNNTAIVQMAALAECPAGGDLGSKVPYLVINEVTTVAFAYAMGGFATNAFNVSSDATGAAAIANALANANNIVNLQYGQAPTAARGNSNSINPQSKIYALANILAACVNTPSGAAVQCANLFRYAATSSGAQATDESSAIFNIVHNQAKNVASLWNLSPTTPIFAPTLKGQPTDWTMPVIYTGVFGSPSGMAFDASGNAWIADTTSNAVVKVDPQGAVSSYTNGGNFGSIAGVAVNPVTGTIWASDASKDAVYILDSTGSLLTTITTGKLNKPAGIAFDRSGNGYVVNSGAYVVGEYTSAGELIGNSSYPSAQGYSKGIAVDYLGNVYTAAGSGNTGVGVLLAGTTAGQFFSGSNAGGTYAIALDATSNTALSPSKNWTVQNNVWTMATGGFGWRYYLYTSGDQFAGIVGGTYIGWTGGISPGSTPSSLAFDGAGSLWVANATPASSSYPLSGFTVSNSYGLTAMATNGFSTGAGATGAYMAAPDGSGNVWVLNKDGSVSQMLGLSTPVATPMAPGNFSTKP